MRRAYSTNSMRRKSIPGSPPADLSFATHSRLREHYYLVVLGIILALTASLFPVLLLSSYSGSPDLHAAMEVVGGVCGMVTGFVFVMHFWAVASRFYLFVGMAFFINGAEDLAHGSMAFSSTHGWVGLPASDLAQFIPGTYVTGRFLMALLLVVATLIPFMQRKSRNSRLETVWVCPVAVVIAAATTVGAFYIPLPHFIYPDRIISRPVDMASAFVFATALGGAIWKYHRDRDTLTWWIALSIGVNVVGQVLMSFSKTLFDPFFDIAHAYKVLGYLIPLLGFSIYQITIITQRKRAEEERPKQARLATLRVDVGTILSKGITLRSMLQGCAEAMVKHLNAAFARIWRLNEAENVLELQASAGMYTHIDGPYGRVPVGKFKIGLIALERKPHLTNTVLDDPRIGDREWAKREGMVAFAGYPLIVEDRLVGVMAVFARQPLDKNTLDALALEAPEIALGIQRKLAEGRLKETMAELERSNLEFQQFAHVASHDLKEPLRTVSNYVEMLRKRYEEKIDAKADRWINYIVGGTERMQTLIDDMLTYSSVGTGDKGFEPTDSAAAYEVAVTNLKDAIKESRAEVTRDDLPTVMADHTQLVQLFQNLISNAIRFCGDESPKVHVSTELKDRMWQFSVRDSGIGIDPKHAERIFIIFQRLHTAEEYPGTGIGLAVCKKIVEGQGGHIWVESEPGRGSTFYFTIPELSR